MNDEQIVSGAAIRWVRKACEKCGASNERTAAGRCRPTQDQTGEYSCPAGDAADAEGFFLAPSAASIRQIDAAIDRIKQS
jgi:hypothetical protein